LSKEISDMLEDAEELEVNEEGEIVRGSQSQKPKGRGVRLKDHTFYR